MKTLFNSLIFPYYSYCLEVWGSCHQKFQKRIKDIQKKSIRAVKKAHWLAHTEPRMKSLNILKLEDQRDLQCLGLLYNMLKGHSPDLFDLVCNQNVNNAQHSLRSGSDRPDDLRLPPFKAHLNRASFLSHTPHLWNTLPTTLQSACNCKLFKKGLRTKILSQYSEKVACSNSRCNDHRFHT